MPGSHEYAGAVVVEWPTRRARNHLIPVVWQELTVRDAHTGEAFAGVTRMVITADTAGQEVTVELTEIATEDGAPIRQNNARDRAALDEHGNAKTVTGTFLLAPCLQGRDNA